jgi:ATP-dependent DNA helicase RecG
VQAGQSFNSQGKPEIPLDVFEELIVNALIHRDYLVEAPIRLLIFTDRIEIISPGHLPNNLDVEKIRAGMSNSRNPILLNFIAKGLLPYKGLGSGIKRALRDWPAIDFQDNRESCLFTATVHRKPGKSTQKSIEKIEKSTQESSLKNGKSIQKTKNGTLESIEKTERNAPIRVEKSELSIEKSELSIEKTEKRIEKMGQNALKILALMRSDSTITTSGLAERIGITPGGVSKQLEKLRKLGRIRRIGPDKGGHWEVVE